MMKEKENIEHKLLIGKPVALLLTRQPVPIYRNSGMSGRSRCSAAYNGDLSAMTWKVTGETIKHGYFFSYDNLSRIYAAHYAENDQPCSNYSVTYAYDKQGNILALRRYENSGFIDDLTISYTGNRLLKVEDAVPNILFSGSADFKNYSNATTEYTYNANGAMTQDLNKGISDIQYNSLNLPRLTDIKSPVAEARNEYTYSAGGRKLKVVQKWNQDYSTTPVIGSAINVSSLTMSKTTDYIGNMIYEVGMLKRILVDGGYIDGGVYHYYLTDHLGNNRVVVNESGDIVQKNHYYPFGMGFANNTSPDAQPYKYNNKELDQMHGLNWYDNGARFYDPAFPHTPTMDRHAENYYGWSPYSWVANNPMKYVDPNGMDWYQAENGNVMWRRLQDKEYIDGDGNVWNNVGENYLFMRGDNATLFQQYTNDEGKLYLSSSTYNLADEKSANSLTSILGDNLSKGSAIAGAVGGLAEGSNATFRLTNSKGALDFAFYGNGWKGNQWVTPQAFSKVGTGLKFIGGLAAFGGITVSGVQFFQAPTLEGKFEHGLDAFMGGIGYVPYAGTAVSLFWNFGGKKLHYNWTNRVLTPAMQMGLPPYSYSPTKY